MLLPWLTSHEGLHPCTSPCVRDRGGLYGEKELPPNRYPGDGGKEGRNMPWPRENQAGVKWGGCRSDRNSLCNVGSEVG